MRALKEYKEKVDLELRDFFIKKFDELSGKLSFAQEIVRHLQEYTLRGGKRMRGALVNYGYICLDGKDRASILKTSMCIELVQSFLLIHDDVMDKDDFRRGGLTIHKTYEDIFRQRHSESDSRHFGVSAAIVVGNIAAALAYEILASANFHPVYKITAIDKLSQTIRDVNYGQMLDVSLQKNDRVTEAEVLELYKLKTARYTTEGPLHIGAILAGGSKDDLTLLSNYAIPLGIAFQIKDDILEMFRDKEISEKSSDSDLRQEKQTLLVVKALERASPQKRKILLHILGNTRLTDEEIEEAKEIITQTGSLDYSRELAKDLVQRAKKSLQGSNFTGEGKEFLNEIADYIVRGPKCS